MTPAHSCSWRCRVWCFLQLHRWSHPGGHCVCCGRRDGDFLTDRERAEVYRRLEARRVARLAKRNRR